MRDTIYSRFDLKRTRQKWEHDFEFDRKNTQVPLWVKFPGLPVEYWPVEALSKIASVVGRLMHTDHFTTNADMI